MPEVDTGSYHFSARARLMLLLGEQLITNEAAAVSELVKNSYDADASQVEVLFHGITENPLEAQDNREKKDEDKDSFIQIKDDGSGMNRETLLNGWLELATPIKAEKTDEVRYTKKFKRPVLGEKGLGRLSVHKLGVLTSIVTRSNESKLENVLTIDWRKFEDPSKFLDSIPVQFTERNPEVFLGDTHGTSITIRGLQRKWDQDLLDDLVRKLNLLSSPISGIRNFKVNFEVVDELQPKAKTADFGLIANNSIYTFVGKVSSNGKLTFKYEFNRPDFPGLSREVEEKEIPVQDPERFPEDRVPASGPFTVTFYSWELTDEDKELVFGGAEYFEEFVRPNIGVKVFRDGFRVLPYGDEDNDWLGLDRRRTKRFEEAVSREQIIGFIDITHETNPELIDKSDREGLIDNDAYRDFFSQIMVTLKQFEKLRLVDKTKLKEKMGRTIAQRQKRYSQRVKGLIAYARSSAFSSLPKETTAELERQIIETGKMFEDVLEEHEQPLLKAAAIGLSSLIPMHEAQRNIQEAIKVLKNIQDQTKDNAKAVEDVANLLKLLRETENIVSGITKIQARGTYEERFELERPIELAHLLFRERFRRRKIVFEKDFRKKYELDGSVSLLSLAVINMLDNSMYWLERNSQGDRKIRAIIDEYDSKPAIIISDNGPGINDNIETITMPFVTTKPKGMGLGLYIANRIAQNHGAQLYLPDRNEVPGLLNGANIAIVFEGRNVRDISKKQ